MDEWSPDTLFILFQSYREEVNNILEQRDIRHQQRFDAQQSALRDTFTGLEKQFTIAMLAAEKAVTKAETAAERRFDAVNEFRNALSDQATKLLTRSEAEAHFSALLDKIDGNTTQVAKVELDAKLLGSSAVKREDLNPIYAIINKLQDASSVYNGKNQAISMMFTAAFSAIALAVSIGGLIVSIRSSATTTQVTSGLSQDTIVLANKLDGMIEELQKSRGAVSRDFSPGGGSGQRP